MSPPKPSPPSKSPSSTPTPSTTPNNNQPPPIVVTNSPKEDIVDDTTLSVPVVSEKVVNNKRNTTKYILAAGILGALILAIAIWLYPQLLNHNNGKLFGDHTVPHQPPNIVNPVVEGGGDKSETTTVSKKRKCIPGCILRPTESDFTVVQPKTKEERQDELRQMVAPFHGPAKVKEGTLLEELIGGIYEDETSGEHEYCGLVKVWEGMVQDNFKVTTPLNTNRKLIIWDELLMKNIGRKKCVYYCELQRSNVPDFMKIGRCTNAGQCYCVRYAIDKKKCLGGVPVDGDPNCYCMFSLDDTVEEDRQPVVDLLEKLRDAYDVDFEDDYKELELGTALTAEDETGLSINFMFIIYLFLAPGSDSYFEGGESVESLAVGVFMNIYESMMQQVVQAHGYDIEGVMHENLQSPILQFVEKQLTEVDDTIELLLKDMEIIHVVKPKEGGECVDPCECMIPDNLGQVTMHHDTSLAGWDVAYDGEDTSPPIGTDIKEDQDKYGYVHDEDDDEEDSNMKKTPEGFVRDGTQIVLTKLLLDLQFGVWNSRDAIEKSTISSEFDHPYWDDLLEGKASVHDPSSVWGKNEAFAADMKFGRIMNKFEKTKGDPYSDAWMMDMNDNAFIFKQISQDVVKKLEDRGYMVHRRVRGAVYMWKENDDCQVKYVRVHPAPWPAFGSYPNGGPGYRVPYSITELEIHLQRALETALAIEMARGFREGKLDPKSPFKASRKFFGNVLPAWGFRTYCIRNAHFSTKACALISKVMMAVHLLDDEDLHPLAMSTLKNMFVSKKERNEANRDGLGGKSGIVREFDLGDKFRAIFSTPGMFDSDWGQGDNECTEAVNEFAKFLVSQTTWRKREHFENWLDVTMSKKVVPCVVEAIRKAYTDANPDFQTSREQKDEEKRKAREERRRSGSA